MGVVTRMVTLEVRCIRSVPSYAPEPQECKVDVDRDPDGNYVSIVSTVEHTGCKFIHLRECFRMRPNLRPRFF